VKAFSDLAEPKVLAAAVSARPVHRHALPPGPRFKSIVGGAMVLMTGILIARS
jgi:hypothetical protein